MVHGFNLAEVQEVCGAADIVSLDPGEFLFREGDPAHALCIVKQGVLRIVSGSTVYEPESEEARDLSMTGINSPPGRLSCPPGKWWMGESRMRAFSGVMMLVGCIIAVAPFRPAAADDLACISTTFRFIGANDKVCVSAFDDPKVEGIACHISQARKGGVKGSLGLAEDPSRFSIACRQVGPITADLAKLPEEEPVYSARTSVFFKHTQVYRILDKKRNTLVYIAISDKIIEGSPQNSMSTVPVMPWGR